MSYSLPIRVLEALQRQPKANLWRENLENILLCNVAVPRKQRVMGQFEGALPSLARMGDCWRELSALDISPTGLLLWKTHSEHAIAHLWNAYNVYSDVLDCSAYTARGIQPSRSISRVHELLLDAYRDAFEESLGRNCRHARLPDPNAGLNLGDLARILGSPTLVQDACDFFLLHPRAKVSQFYVAVGLHPRTAERRLMAEGVTAIAIKRACALSSACKYVLWSDFSLAEIARRFGYTDGAHLHHEFRRATGGIPPSVFRQAGRLVH